MPKRHLLSLLVPLVAAALLTLSVHARAQTRVALVIGNSGYQKVVNLANPAHDAQDVSESLKRLGFTVKTVIDADFNGFRRAMLEFGRMAVNSDMAVFYFAGHGVEINGNNWLLPTDVELKDEADASTEAMGLQSAMQAVAAAKTLGLVILDACRNNPFQSMRRAGATRSVHVLGLAAVEPTENVLVAYAARDGTVAADGAGRNSPYTTALLKHLETPGLEVDFLFRNVRDDVMAATKNEQQPFLYGSLSSDEIYFKTAPAVADAAPPPDASEIAWSFLRATNDVSTLSRFVDRFPESAHVSEAKVRIAALDAPPAPTAIDVALPPLVHLATFVDTEFDQAEKAVARRFVRDTPAVEQAWNAIKETKDHTVIRHFVERFPSKTRRVAAETHLAALGQKPITVHVAPWESLFQMVESKRFDFFPLGASEASTLLHEYQSLAPNAIVDTHLVLIYPFGRLFFVRKDNAALRDAIQSGLEQAFADGSFQQLFEDFWSLSLTPVNLKERTPIRISNLNLTPAFLKIPRKYFYDIEK